MKLSFLECVDEKKFVVLHHERERTKLAANNFGPIPSKYSFSLNWAFATTFLSGTLYSFYLFLQRFTVLVQPFESLRSPTPPLMDHRSPSSTAPVLPGC
jgi:hypothetical protein